LPQKYKEKTVNKFDKGQSSELKKILARKTLMLRPLLPYSDTTSNLVSRLGGGGGGGGGERGPNIHIQEGCQAFRVRVSKVFELKPQCWKHLADNEGQPTILEIYKETNYE
jgi:hypothetical protein